MKKRAVVVASVALLASALGLSGCGGAAANGSGGAPVIEQKAKTPAKDEIKVEDIAWSVESGVDGGNRRMLFEYENKSDYDVLSVKLEGKLAADLADEDVETGFSNIVKDGVELESLKAWTFNAEVGELVVPGGRSKSDEVCLGIYYLLDEGQYSMMTPDMLTIEFLADGKLYTEYYDYLSKSYSLSSDVVDVDQWSTSELASLMPKQDDLLVADITESSTRFGFETVGTTPESYESYVQACKDAGFGFNVTSGDGFFYSSSEDGKYSLNIFYNDNSEMTVYFDLKDRKETE